MRTRVLSSPWLRLITGAVGVVLIAMAFFDVGRLSLFGNDYNLSLIRINQAVAFMVAILGLQVITGFTGQVSLGQSFFFGLGAYTSAYFVQDLGWPYLATLGVVVPVCFVVGVILGLPALRIQGLYLALLTFAIAAVFPSLVRLPALAEITRGSDGKLIDADLVAPEWLPLDSLATALQALPLAGGFFGDGGLAQREADRVWTYLLIASVAVACFWLVRNLIDSAPGRAMRAVRDNPASAAVFGINVAATKTMAFGIGSALGGVGGALYVMELGIASPDDFTQLLAINLIVGLVVGGNGTLLGAAIGGLVITFIPDWASSTTSIGVLPDRALQGPTGTLILGALLIVLTFVMPGGVASGLAKLRTRLSPIAERAQP